MADMVNVVNTILANGSEEYQNRVPLATQTNIDTVGRQILSYTTTTNEFLSALINKIAFTLVINKTWSNPLAVLKKGDKPLGKDIEVIHTNPAKAESYEDSEDFGARLLEQVKPDVATEYYRVNRRDQYTVSVNRQSLRFAFTSWDNLESLLNEIVNSLYSGDYIDEFILTKDLFAKGVTNAEIKTVDSVEVTDEASGKQLIKDIKTASSAFTYPSTLWNSYDGGERMTWTPKENQLLIVRSDLINLIDVDVLAQAFNIGKLDFMAQTLEVDNFGSNEDIQAILLDRAAVQVWDDLTELTEFYNPKSMVWNYYWNHWQTFALSKLANAVAFVKPADAGV